VAQRLLVAARVTGELFEDVDFRKCGYSLRVCFYVGDRAPTTGTRYGGSCTGSHYDWLAWHGTGLQATVPAGPALPSAS